MISLSADLADLSVGNSPFLLLTSSAVPRRLTSFSFSLPRLIPPRSSPNNMAQLAMSELEKAVAAKDLRVIEEACAVDHQVVYQKGAPPLARTLLHTACAAGVCDVAQYLIEHGALVNEKDGEQATPLILASESGSEPIVRLLLLTSCVSERASESLVLW